MENKGNEHGANVRGWRLDERVYSIISTRRKTHVTPAASMVASTAIPSFVGGNKVGTWDACSTGLPISTRIDPVLVTLGTI